MSMFIYEETEASLNQELEFLREELQRNDISEKRKGGIKRAIEIAQEDLKKLQQSK